MIRLVIADDHPLILEGVERMFRSEGDFDLLARCGDGEEAAAAVARTKPDVAIFDIRMPKLDGVAALERLRSGGVTSKVVLLTAGLDDGRILDGFRVGAEGIVLKEMAPRLLVETVRRVHAGGQCWDNPSVMGALRRMMQQEHVRSRAATLLTPRETEITAMVASGLRNKEIAFRLSISEGTVKLHLNSIYEKLGVDGRVPLTLWAREAGLV